MDNITLGTVYKAITGSNEGLIEELEPITVSSTQISQEVQPSAGKIGFSRITISPNRLQEKDVTPTAEQVTVQPNPEFYGLSRVTVAPVSLQEKNVTPTAEQVVVQPDPGFYGLSRVTVAPVSGGSTKPPVYMLKLWPLNAGDAATKPVLSINAGDVHPFSYKDGLLGIIQFTDDDEVGFVWKPLSETELRSASWAIYGGKPEVTLGDIYGYLGIDFSVVTPGDQLYPLSFTGATRALQITVKTQTDTGSMYTDIDFINSNDASAVRYAYIAHQANPTYPNTMAVGLGWM